MKQEIDLSKHNIDLSKFSYEQLKALIEDASICMDTLREEKKNEAKQHALAVAKQFDLSIEDLFPEIKQKSFISPAVGEAARADTGRKRKDPEFVYLKPDNKSLFYKGFGPNPKWFKEMSSEAREAAKVPFDPELHRKN